MTITVEGPNPADSHGCQLGCVRLSAYLRARYSLRDDGCYNPLSTTSSGAPSYHVHGDAIDLGADWHNAAERERGDQCFAWVVQNAEALNLQELIWGDRILTSRRWSEGIRHYGGGDHYNHLHIALGTYAAQHWGGAQPPEPGDEDLTPEQAQKLDDLHAFMTASKHSDGKPMIWHVFQAFFNPGATARQILRNVDERTIRIAKKLGVAP